MGMIQRRIRLAGSVGEYEADCLFDSGASVSCIRPDIAEGIERPVRFSPPLKISTAGDKTFMEVNERIAVDFYIDGLRFFTDFFLVPGLTEEVIIGAVTLQQWRFKLDFEKDELVIDPRMTRMRI
jgi:hypothetical protein